MIHYDSMKYVQKKIKKIFVKMMLVEKKVFIFQ